MNTCYLITSITTIRCYNDKIFHKRSKLIEHYKRIEFHITQYYFYELQYYNGRMRFQRKAAKHIFEIFDLL